MKIFANLDMNKNQLLNPVLQNLATDPSSPVKGQAYFNTVNGKMRTYNGSTWDEYGTGSTMTGADIVTAINGSASKIDDDNLSTGVNSAVTNNHTHTNKALLDAFTPELNVLLGDAINKKHDQNTDTGTSNPTFTVGPSGVKIKNVGSTELQVRNNADSGFADMRVGNLVVEGTTTTVNSTTVELGDSEIELNAKIVTSSANSDGGITIKRLMADNTTRKDAKITYNNSTGRWQTTQGAVTGTLITTALANKVVATIGDNSATVYIITHGLNTQDLNISIRETASPFALVLADVEFTSVNTITVKFAVAPTANQFTVTIIG